VVAGSRFPNGLENRGAMMNRNGATPSTTAILEGLSRWGAQR
jgi:hypothetical protein